MKKNIINKIKLSKGSKNIISNQKLLLRTLIAVIVVLFVAFYSIGYNNAYEEDANFNSPLLTDVIIYFTMLLFIIAIIAISWAMVIATKKHKLTNYDEHHIPIKSIKYTLFIAMIVVLIICIITASSQPLLINGKLYTNIAALKLADVFVKLSLVMIVFTICAIAIGKNIKLFKKENKK